MKLQVVSYATLLMFVTFAASPVRADVYDTTYAWNGSNYINAFGNPNTATYGQTFVAPTDGQNVLTSFTFYLESPVGDNAEIEADVFAWSGNTYGGHAPQGATGPALYTSASFLYTGTGGFVATTVLTGGVALTPGENYVALFTVSDGADYADSGGGILWGDISGSADPGTHVAGDGGGGFNFLNNGNDYALLNDGDWSANLGNDDFVDFGDLAWTANFSGAAVPEPASLLLLGTVTVGLLSRLRRRARQ